MDEHDVAIISDHEVERFAMALKTRLDEGFTIEHIQKNGSMWNVLLIKRPPA